MSGLFDDASGALPDSVIRHPTIAFTPPRWHPFVQLARLDRPIGWWLLLLPCWWSTALAALAQGHGPYLSHILLFLIGAIAMRGAGATYNDLVDRDIDARVERTRGRPLPSGRATPKAAKLFLIAQCVIGWLVLLSFNAFSIALGIASLAIVLLYPFMKRVTSWPQAVLGLAFAWGGLMGWAAIFGTLAWAAVLIYLAAIFWTIGYDTIYAVQDVRDDPAAGVKSTARLFGTNVRIAVGLLYAGAALCAGAAVARVAPHGLAAVFAWSGVAAFAAHLAWQISVLRADDGAIALKLFRANRNAGLLLFGGLLAASFAAAV